MANQLSDLQANKNRICLIHYACTDISKMPIKIPCIAVAEYANRKLRVFAEMEGKNEEDVLREFYDFVVHNFNYIYVGWNFKGVTYGLPVIERRYKELFKKKPSEINLVFDLDDILEQVYGRQYVDHGTFGKLHNLLTLNDISTKNFIDGKTEAELCKKNDLRPVERSTESKVHGMVGILDLLFSGKLKTSKQSKVRKLIYKIENSTIYKLACIIAVIITILGAYWLLKLIT